jgi:CheY-like chemotaxis protein
MPMPQKILIVDDDPDVVLFLATVLKDHGYETLEAPDGRAGLEKALRDRPDLILLDLMMPHKSGIALLSDLGQDEALKEIPVIMVTGVTGETGIVLDSFLNREAAPKAAKRPEGYLAKPIDPDELMRAVKQTIG